MVIKSWDDTFTIKEGIDVTRHGCDSQPLYGRAFGCPSPVGEVQVNLQSTGFYIPSTVYPILLKCFDWMSNEVSTVVMNRDIYKKVKKTALLMSCYVVPSWLNEHFHSSFNIQ